MQNRFKQTVILSLATLLSMTFSMTSQANTTEIPTYKIEVIIFESLATKGWTEEYWSNEVDLPYTENAVSVFSTGKRPLFIESSDKEMVDKANTLNKRGYRVIFHQAWTQQAHPNKNIKPVLVEGSTKYGTNMLGTVRLYKTRYAHVNFDLNFDRRIPDSVKTLFADNQQIAIADLPEFWSFNLAESRKIKPGQLHYLDHPLFGALVRISKVKDN